MTIAEESLGEQIRQARVAKGLGLRELARLIDKAPSYVSDIEYDRRVPSEAVLHSLCDALDLDFDKMQMLTGRLGEEADRFLRRQPAAGLLLRRVQERGFNGEDLHRVIEQVERIAEEKKRGKK